MTSKDSGQHPMTTDSHISFVIEAPINSGPNPITLPADLQIVKSAAAQIVNAIQVEHHGALLATVSCLISHGSAPPHGDIVGSFRSGTPWTADMVCLAEGRGSVSRLLAALLSSAGREASGICGRNSFQVLASNSAELATVPDLIPGFRLKLDRHAYAISPLVAPKNETDLLCFSPVLYSHGALRPLVSHVEVLYYLFAFDTEMGRLHRIVGQRIHAVISNGLMFHVEYDICKSPANLPDTNNEKIASSREALTSMGVDLSSAPLEVSGKEDLKSDGFISARKSRSVFFGTSINSIVEPKRTIDRMISYQPESTHGDVALIEPGEVEISPRRSRALYFGTHPKHLLS